MGNRSDDIKEDDPIKLVKMGLNNYVLGELREKGHAEFYWPTGHMKLKIDAEEININYSCVVGHSGTALTSRGVRERCKLSDLLEAL